METTWTATRGKYQGKGQTKADALADLHNKSRIYYTADMVTFRRKG